MSGQWTSGASWLDYSPGDFAGTGGYTIVVLTNPTSTPSGLVEWLNGGGAITRGSLLLYNWRLFGQGDNSEGYGPVGPPAPGWQLWAITKPNGSAHYRFHRWNYAPDGSGTMVHGESVGAADHDNGLIADTIRVGDFGNGSIGAAGLIAAAALWDRALSDSELETLVSNRLADWHALSPNFGVDLSGWDGASGDVVFAGASARIAKQGTVAAGGNPSGFDFSVDVPPDLNAPPTVSAGADQLTTTGQQVTLTAAGADTDGTIATYVWTQVSGPAVTLAGAGASRTFTPTAPGVRIFSVQAFDDDGAASTADTVTVTTTSPPPVNIVGEAGTQADVDALSVVLAHLKAHVDVTALFGASLSGLIEGPWPHLMVTDGPGGDLREGRWSYEQEILFEVYGDPDGRPGKAALRNMAARVLAAIKELPDLPVTDPTQPVVSRVRPTGVHVWNPLSNGQGVYTTSVMVTVRPPRVLP